MDKIPSSIHVSLFRRFFSPNEAGLSEVARRVAGYLFPRDTQAMMCVNRGCHGFFMVLRKEVEVPEEADDFKYNPHVLVEEHQLLEQQDANDD